MASKTVTIADFQQQSSWVVEFLNPPGDNVRTSGPSTSTQTKYFNFSTIPVGSIINSATLTATVGGTNYTIRTLDGSFFSGSRNVKAKVAPGDSSVGFTWVFKGSGSTASVGSITATLQYSNVRIVIDYTLPASTVTLNKTTCPAGGVVRANLSIASSSYTHKVYFSMTGVTTVEYTLAAGVTYKDFTIPLAWQEAIPNNVSRVITCTLKTYSGATQMGTDQTDTVTMTLSADAYPVLGSVVAALDLNGLPGTFTKHIQGKTKLLVTLSDETLAYESPISTRKVTINGVQVTASGTPITALFDPIALSGDVPINAVITDGRGRTGSKSITVHIEPYSAPSLTGIEAYRADSSGDEDDAGTYIFLKATGVCSSVAGENAVTLQGRYGIVGGAYGAWSDMTGGTAIKSVLLGGALAVNVSYNAQIKAVDTVGTEYIYTALIPQETVTLNFKEGGSGAAFGGYADTADLLKVVWSLMTLGGDPVCAIKVGQLYISRDDTDPSTIWTGTTWYALPEETFPMAAGVNHVPGGTGDEGGASSHSFSLGSAGYAKLSSGGKSKIKSGLSAYATDYLEADYAPGASGSTATNGIELGGATESGSTLPKYRSYYMWERLT
ncbi:MAG: DUF859 family phage minor structural protein [Candidatus Micrarchaeia archaeon]|jgi:hypothetical protein